MPEFKDITDEIANAARDVAYVVVGLGVLGFQRAQVRRHELTQRLAEPRAQVEDRLMEAREQLARRVKLVDSKVDDAITRIESTLEPIEQLLPPQARDLVQQAHAQVREAHQQLRNLLGPLAA
jgi:hypothetical protein